MTPKQVLSSLSAFVLYLALAQPSHAAGEFEEQDYKKAGEVSLRMRIYKPQEWTATDQRPAIVFFFGGGWSKGTPDQFHEHCRHLAAQGIVAMAADYRVKTKHDTRPTDSVNDAKAAVRWARENAAKLGIDPARIAAGGGSAGGHLAAATATVGKGSEVPDALLLFNPAPDLLFRPSILEKWNATEDEFRAISPFHHLAKDLPRTVIFHGTKDTAVPYESIVAFVEKAEKLGAPKVLLHTYEGRPHGFFNFGRGNGKDYAETVRKMDAFLTGLGWLK